MIEETMSAGSRTRWALARWAQTTIADVKVRAHTFAFITPEMTQPESTVAHSSREKHICIASVLGGTQRGRQRAQEAWPITAITRLQSGGSSSRVGPASSCCYICISAIAITFWYGGTKPGIVAVLLSSLIRGFIFEAETSSLSQHFPKEDLASVPVSSIPEEFRKLSRLLPVIVLSHTVEVAGASHAVYVSHPKEVADVIEGAARAASKQLGLRRESAPDEHSD